MASVFYKLFHFKFALQEDLTNFAIVDLWPSCMLTDILSDYDFL